MAGTTPIIGFRDRRNVPVYIYALAEPDTQAIRYIGKSQDPWKRYINHLHWTAASTIAKWCNALAKHGQKPCLRILHEVAPGDDADFWEQAFLRLHRWQGTRLLNNRYGCVLPYGFLPWSERERERMRAINIFPQPLTSSEAAE